MIAPMRTGMKIRNQSLCFLLGVASSVSSSAFASLGARTAGFLEEDASFVFSPMLICWGAFFLERRISMKMQTASTRAQTITTGIQILLMTLANPELLDEERDGNEPPFWKLEGSKSPLPKFDGSKLPSPGVKDPREGFFESESESESEELLSGLDGLSESESESEEPLLSGLVNPGPELDGSKTSGMFSGSKFSGSKSPLKPPGKPDESDELKPDGMLPRPDFEPEGSANFSTIVAIMRIVNTNRTIV